MHYIIKGLGRGFDGLMVETGDRIEDWTDDDKPNTKHEVLKVTNRNEIFGDRNVSFPIAKDALFIGEQYLEKIVDPATREYDAKNPWGKCLFEGRYSKDTLSVAYAQFELCLQVTVSEKINGKNRTVYTGYVDGTEDMVSAKRLIEDSLSSDDGIEDLVFSLRSFNGED